MYPQLPEFVNSCLESIGADRQELGVNSGVYRATLPSTDPGKAIARYLGRETSELLYTFDLARWEEGAKLECLTEQSPLVTRLRSLAIAQGRFTTAYIQGNPPWIPVLMARFQTTFRYDQVVTKSDWIALRFDTQKQISIKGSPLEKGNLIDGLPRGVEPLTGATVLSGLQVLAEIWNRHAAEKSDQIQVDLERRYSIEAEEVISSRSGEDQERILSRIQDRLRLTVESSILMAIVALIPSSA